MTILRNRRLNGRPYLLTFPIPTNAGADDLAFFMGTLGLDTVAGTSAPSNMSQPFTLTNWSNVASLGLYKRGTWFKKGDVPAGQIPALSSGTAQFYGLRSWKDGSLKYARMLLRDANLAAGATRSYSLTATTAIMPLGSVATIGNAGLTKALTNRDIKLAFSNVKTWDCSSTSGNYAALGSGAFTASLAAHARISTRWSLLTSGSVADVWQGWGMATDNTKAPPLKYESALPTRA